MIKWITAPFCRYEKELLTYNTKSDAAPQNHFLAGFTNAVDKSTVELMLHIAQTVSVQMASEYKQTYPFDINANSGALGISHGPLAVTWRVGMSGIPIPAFADVVLSVVIRYITSSTIILRPFANIIFVLRTCVGNF